jgi:hypothetical protein
MKDQIIVSIPIGIIILDIDGVSFFVVVVVVVSP